MPVGSAPPASEPAAPRSTRLAPAAKSWFSPDLGDVGPGRERLAHRSGSSHAFRPCHVVGNGLGRPLFGGLAPRPAPPRPRPRPALWLSGSGCTGPSTTTGGVSSASAAAGSVREGPRRRRAPRPRSGWPGRRPRSRSSASSSLTVSCSLTGLLPISMPCSRRNFSRVAWRSGNSEPPMPAMFPLRRSSLR